MVVGSSEQHDTIENLVRYTEWQIDFLANMSKEMETEKQLEARAVRKLSAYIFWVVLVSMGLLLLNAGLVFGLAKAVEEALPNVPLIGPLSQFSIFILPILLLYLEWYVWDILSSGRNRS